MRKICIFTGSRAEYGLLEPLMTEIKNDKSLHLQILVSGTHLSPEFGMTVKEIEQNSFDINEKIEILMSSDSPVGICKAMGLGLISFSEALTKLKPDFLVILGDRSESLAIAATAAVLKIPIAHIHGGEVTQGAFDEAFRHSITKMSHLHFTSTETYRLRVIQLGEHPDRVFNVGAIGLDNIQRLKLLHRQELEQSIGFVLSEPYILVTFHPVTLEENTADKQFSNLLEAIEEIRGVRVIFTKANADTDGRIINRMIDDYVSKNSHKAAAFTSMGQIRYLSAMKHSSAVVGNSSSGILEAPSFHIPTVNIGDRQKGRIKAESIIDCPPTRDGIITAMKHALSSEFRQSLKNMINPYQKENTAKHIKEIISSFDLNDILKKEFYDLPVLSSM